MSKWMTSLKAATMLIWEQVTATAAWLAATPAGWATLAVGALASVTASIYAYNKSIDTAVDNAREKLSETETLLSSLSTEKDTIVSKIKELETLEKNGSLSIVDKADLEALRNQNEELRIRQMYLTKQQEKENQDLVAASKKKYNRDYAHQQLSRTSIDQYKDALTEKAGNQPPVNTYLTGSTNVTPTSYAPGIEAQQLQTESQTLAANIAKYEYYTEEKKKAFQAGDTKSVEKLDEKLTAVSETIYKSREELQSFTAELSATGESSSELDDANHKLQLINETLYANEKAAFHFINDNTLQLDKKKLVEFAEAGELTTDKLSQNFSGIDAYLKENGFTLNNLISIVKTYKDELLAASDVQEDGTQLINSAKNNLYNQFVGPSIGSDETDFNQAEAQYKEWIHQFNDEDITLLYSIMNDTETAGWSFEDFDKELEQRKKSAIPVSVTLSNALSFVSENRQDELITKYRNGEINESTIDDYQELSYVMKDLGISADDTLKAMGEFSENFHLPTDLIRDIQSSYRILQKVKSEIAATDTVSQETLNSIISQYPELTQAMTNYNLGLMTASDLLSLLENTYFADADAYRSAMLFKLSDNSEFFTKVKSEHQALFTDLAAAYGLDIDNWKTLAQAKAAIDQALIQNLSGAWSKYYGVVYDQETGMASVTGDEHFHGSSQGTNMSQEQQKAYNAVHKQVSERNKVFAALKEAANITIDLPDITSPSSHSSYADSKEPSKKEYDWMERAVSAINKKRSKSQELLDNETLSYHDQISSLQELISLDHQLVEITSSAQSVYTDRWDDISQKMMEAFGEANGNKLISKIQYGDTSLEGSKDSFSSEQAELLDDAINAYDNMKKAEDDYANAVKDHTNHVHEEFAKRVAEVESYVEEVSSAISQAQSKLDFKQAAGHEITESDYQQLIALSRDQLELYDKQIDALHDQLSTVDEFGPEYYSIKSSIASCESAIIDCKIQQQEWNEKIMRLPIERIQKYWNMLAGIKQDLQNFLDEQAAMGIQPTADQLQQLFDISREEIKSLLEQQEKLKELLDQYQYGSEKFNDVSQELQDIDNTISGLIQSQKEWNAAVLQIPIDEMSKYNDTLNLAAGALDDLLSDYDSTLSAVTGTIDKQVESLEDLKSATEETYQSKIDPLQEELDLLQKQNEERQTQLDLEQRQYDLDRARNQKTSQVIRNGELVYEADADAIRDASKGLADAQYNKLVKDLGDQISSLEEERDNLLEGYDSQIEKLNDIKDKWSSIVDEIKQAADLTKADAVLGEGWPDKILSGNDDAIYKLFQGLYDNTTSQKTQLEEQTASNERIAEMMNQFATRYQEGSISYEQAMAGVRELSEQMKNGYSGLEQLNALLGLERTESLESLLQKMQTSANTSVDQFSDYMTIVKANADAMAQYTSSWEEMQQNIKDQIAALQKLAEEAAKVAEAVGKHYSSSRNESFGNSSGPNINDNQYVSDGPGHTAEALAEAIAGGKEILEYHTGGLVGAQDAPSRYIGLLSSKNLSDNEIYGKLLKNEWVMTEEQQKIFDGNIQSILSVNHAPNLHLSSRLPEISSKTPDINISMGDINLNNVSKPDEFAHALATQFKPLLRQEMSKL